MLISGGKDDYVPRPPHRTHTHRQKWRVVFIMNFHVALLQWSNIFIWTIVDSFFLLRCGLQLAVGFHRGRCQFHCGWLFASFVGGKEIMVPFEHDILFLRLGNFFRECPQGMREHHVDRYFNCFSRCEWAVQGNFEYLSTIKAQDLWNIQPNINNDDRGWPKFLVGSVLFLTLEVSTKYTEKTDSFFLVFHDVFFRV